MEQFMLQCVPNYFYCKIEISKSQCHFYEIKQLVNKTTMTTNTPIFGTKISQVVQLLQLECACAHVCVCALAQLGQHPGGSELS